MAQHAEIKKAMATSDQAYKNTIKTINGYAKGPIKDAYMAHVQQSYTLNAWKISTLFDATLLTREKEIEAKIGGKVVLSRGRPVVLGHGPPVDTDDESTDDEQQQAPQLTATVNTMQTNRGGTPWGRR